MLEMLKQLWIKIRSVLARFLPSYTFEIGAKELEKRITPLFPIKKKKLIFVFKITDPEVVLPPNRDNRVGISVSMKVSIPGLLAARGRAVIHGEIDYWAEEGEFYFFDPEIDELEIGGLPGRYQEEVRGLFESIIRSAVSDLCIYKFDPADRKQVIAKRMLKSIKVEDEKLKIQVGL